MLSSVSDRDLMAAYCTDRNSSAAQQAATEIMARHQAAVLDVLTLRLRGDRHTAEDLTQQTFLRAFRFADKFEPDKDSLVSWLLFLARHRLTDETRRRKFRPRAYGIAYDRDGLQQYNVEATSLPSREPDHEVITVQKEMVNTFWEFVDDMTFDDRKTLCLIMVDGYSERQAARILGVHHSTVQKRLKSIFPRLNSNVGDMSNLQVQLDRRMTPRPQKKILAA